MSAALSIHRSCTATTAIQSASAHPPWSEKDSGRTGKVCVTLGYFQSWPTGSPEIAALGPSGLNTFVQWPDCVTVCVTKQQGLMLVGLWIAASLHSGSFRLAFVALRISCSSSAHSLFHSRPCLTIQSLSLTHARYTCLGNPDLGF